MQQRRYPQQWQNQPIYPSLDSSVLEADMSLARALNADLFKALALVAGAVERFAQSGA